MPFSKKILTLPLCLMLLFLASDTVSQAAIPKISPTKNAHIRTTFTASSSVTLTLGDTKSLAFAHPDPLTCHSANAAIVSVSVNGTMRAVSAGTTAVSYLVGGKPKCFTVHVSDVTAPLAVSGNAAQDVMLPADSLKTDRPLLFIEKSDSYKITLTAASTALANRYGGVSFSSDAPEVASVDASGNVWAKKNGTATITCRLKNVSCLVFVNVVSDTYTGKSATFSMLTASGRMRTYTLFKQNAHNYPKYNRYIAWHGCATCSLASVLGAYNTSYAGVLPSEVIDGPEKKYTSSKDWNRHHVNNSLRRQMPPSLYGISTILSACGVKNEYVRTYKDTAAKKDILAHLQEGNAVIFEVRQKNKRTRKKSKRWTNSYHTMIMLGVLTNGKVLLSDSVDRSWYDGGQRLKIVELSDLMAYMFPCTSFSESMYYDGASSDGGYIKVQEVAQ